MLAGDLLPVRRGHLALPGTPADLVRAVRIGGLATATTATKALGIWTPPDQQVHVAVPRNTPRLRDPDDETRSFRQRGDIRLHWTKKLPEAVHRSGMVPLLLALEHVLLCLSPERAVAVLDSAVHERFLRGHGLAALRAGLPTHLALLVDVVDGRCESGIESIARFLLQQLGLTVEPQYKARRVGRIDLLVAGRLIVELDGRQWHDDPEAFERDRRRDAAAWADRYPTIRFTYRQVLFEWPMVQAAILGALATLAA